MGQRNLGKSTGKDLEGKGKKIEMASTVDAIGLFCPIPIVKLKLELEKLASRQIVQVLADDPAFPDDVISWCRETGNRLLSVSKNEENIFVAYVEKHEED
jgi:TusA-related sulfurtransferase